nr:hypothetical protein [Chromobacterium sp. ASV5]
MPVGQPLARQRGSALCLTLALSCLLLYLASAASREGASMQRIAGLQSDRPRAWLAADAALRDAERACLQAARLGNEGAAVDSSGIVLLDKDFRQANGERASLFHITVQGRARRAAVTVQSWFLVTAMTNGGAAGRRIAWREVEDEAF